MLRKIIGLFPASFAPGGIDPQRMQSASMSQIDYAEISWHPLHQESVGERLFSVVGRRELYPLVEASAHVPLKIIVDVGPPEGFYAIDSAALPGYQVIAFRVNKGRSCWLRWRANGVAGITIQGHCERSPFA